MGWVSPAYLGQFGSLFTTITLIVILFESGTSLDIVMLKKSFLGASLLTIFNFVGAFFWLYSWPSLTESGYFA